MRILLLTHCKLLVTQRAKKFAIFMQSEGLLRCIRRARSWSLFGPHESQSPLSLAVLALILMSFQIPQGLWNPLNLRCTVCLCHACCMFRSCHPVWSLHHNNKWRSKMPSNYEPQYVFLFSFFLSSSCPPSWFEIICWEGCSNTLVIYWVWVIIYSLLMVI